MIDYLNAICYGIVVSEEQAEEIDELLEKIDFDEEEDFREEHFWSINEWTPEKWFLGLMYFYDRQVVPFSDIQFSMEDVNELIKKLNQYGITQIVDWKPQMYAIKFCL